MIKLFIKTVLFTMFGIIASVSVFAGSIDKVIVIVNDEVITQREFDRFFEPVKQSITANVKGEELTAKLEEAHNMFLDQLINAKLAVSLAKKEKVEVDKKELKENIDKVKAYYPTEDDFLKALGERGTSLKESEQEIEDQMLARKFIEKKIWSKINITPSEMREVYEKNKEQFIKPKTVKLSEITIRKKDDNSIKKAEEILARLKDGGNFADIAKNESEGPYAEKSGSMGPIAEGQLIKELNDPAMQLKKGELSGIIETESGYHILLAEEIEEKRPLEFEEVSNFIHEQIGMKKFKENLVKWLDTERKNAYIAYK